MSIVHIADGWLLFVALSVDGVLFKLKFRSVAVRWQVWAELMVDGWLLVVSWLESVVLFKLEFIVGIGDGMACAGFIGGSGFADFDGVAD